MGFHLFLLQIILMGMDEFSEEEINQNVSASGAIRMYCKWKEFAPGYFFH